MIRTQRKVKAAFYSRVEGPSSSKCLDAGVAEAKKCARPYGGLSGPVGVCFSLTGSLTPLSLWDVGHNGQAKKELSRLKTCLAILEKNFYRPFLTLLDRSQVEPQAALSVRLNIHYAYMCIQMRISKCIASPLRRVGEGALSLRFRVMACLLGPCLPSLGRHFRTT